VYELALFAGAGGGLLASKWLLGWQTVCYVENEPYCIEVIKARIGDGLLDDAPIWDDARTFDGRPWRGCVDIITAGFPCQPFSQAGKQDGADDNRNLWPDTIRIIREVRPRWVLLENVPGLLGAVDNTTDVPVPYFGTILGDLAESGYSVRWKVLSAAEMGAPHKRDRVWIMAHAAIGSHRGQEHGCQTAGQDATGPTGRTGRSGNGRRAQDVAQTQEQPQRAGLCQSEQAEKRGGRSGDGGGTGTKEISVTFGQGLEKRQGMETKQTRKSKISSITRGSGWAVEPDMGRVANGVAHRVDRLKTLGNGQVPIVVATVWELLKELSG